MAQVKLEVLEVLAEVKLETKAECLPSDPLYAHKDARSPASPCRHPHYPRPRPRPPLLPLSLLPRRSGAAPSSRASRSSSG